MKKLAVLFICVVMLASMAVSTSAAGQILWHDDFSDRFTNPNNWILEGNEFFCDDFTDSANPCIVAYDPGRVCQMAYTDSSANPRKYTNCSMMVKVQIRDFDSDRCEHKVGLWWRDDFYANAEELGVELGEVYNFYINADTLMAELWEEGVENALMTAPVSGVEVGGDWFTIGWKIVPGNISCYLNGNKVIEYASANVAATQASPILLLNNACYSAWDDVIVATADYALFNETPAPAVTTAPATTRVEQVTVTNEKGEAVTDENGQAVTETVIITEAPADTNTGAVVGGNATATGDTAFIVVAAMVAALGCAIIVKKVNVR